LGAWHSLHKHGILRATQDFVEDKDNIPAYTWLIEQMKIRIGPPPIAGLFPIWGWYQWLDESRNRPDIRAIRWWHPAGEKNVRIEIECDENKILLSDYDLWHFVLNYWYLATSEKDHDRFHRNYPDLYSITWQNLDLNIPSKKFHQLIRDRWQLIFDIDWENEDAAHPRSKKSIQATLWEINLAMVRDVTEFKGSPRR